MVSIFWWFWDGGGIVASYGDVLTVMVALEATIHVVVALVEVVRFCWFLECFL